MTSHKSGLEKVGAREGTPAKPHPKEELKWLRNVSIGKEAPKPWWSLTLGGEGGGCGRKSLQYDVHLGKTWSQGHCGGQGKEKLPGELDEQEDLMEQARRMLKYAKEILTQLAEP